MSTHRSPNQSVPTVKDLIVGTAKRFPGATSIAFGNATYTAASLTALLQSFVDLVTALYAARAAYKAQLAAVRAQAPALLVVIHAYVLFVRATFGESPDALMDFGLLPPKKPAPETVEQKAAAAAKRRATRAARHTLGAKQKAGIKGTVAGSQGSDTGTTGSVTNGTATEPATPATTTTTKPS